MTVLKLTKKYNSYPRYKDSGIEWLSRIPENWNLKRLKYLAPLVSRKVRKENLQGTYVALENIEAKTGKYIPSFEIIEPESIVNVFESTDVLFGKLRPYLAKVFVPTFSGTSTGEFLVLRPEEEMVQKYLFYRLLSQELINTVNDSTYGAQMPRASWSFIGNLPITLPSKKEQEEIVTYLDQKMLILDQIIEKKRIQIEIIIEKRSAFINSTISEISGKLSKLKNHVAINPSKEPITEIATSDLVSFVPMEALSGKGVLAPQEKKYKDVKNGFTYFKDGDVVLAKITPCYENGKAGVVKGLKNGFGFGTTEFMVLRPNNSIMANYLYYLIHSDKFRKSGEVEMRGTAGQKRITTNFVKNYEFSLPSLTKQRDIVDLLNKKTELFDKVIRKIELSIDLIKEFKSSIISNAVTGKIKV